MIGACGLALLQQGQQFEQGVPGESCARPRGIVRVQVGRRDGDTKPQGPPVGHDDVSGALGRMADGQDLEGSAVEGVGGFRHHDHVGIGPRWVLEGGIMLLSRSTASTTRSCCRTKVPLGDGSLRMTVPAVSQSRCLALGLTADDRLTADA